METTLGKIQAMQHTLATDIAKMQNYIIQDADQDKTPRVDERLAISEPLPSLAGPSGETVEFSELIGRTFQEDLEDQLRLIKEIYPKESL